MIDLLYRHVGSAERKQFAIRCIRFCVCNMHFGIEFRSDGLAALPKNYLIQPFSDVFIKVTHIERCTFSAALSVK